VQLLRRGEGDKEDVVLAMDVKPSRVANVRQLMVDKDTVFLASSEGAIVWEKSTSLLSTVGQHVNGADQLTFDAATVYWMGNDCTLRKVPRAGGKVEEIVKMSVSYCGLSSLAVDESNVFFSADETIHTIGKNKSGRRTLLPKREARYVLGLTVDADSVYVLYSGPNGSSSAKELGKLVRVPKKGGAAKELATMQASSQAHTLTMDEKNLYFLESAERNVVVAAVPKTGGPKRVLAQVPGLGYAISVGATSVYFVAWEMGAGVRSRPKLYRIVK